MERNKVMTDKRECPRITPGNDDRITVQLRCLDLLGFADEDERNVAQLVALLVY